MLEPANAIRACTELGAGAASHEQSPKVVQLRHCKRPSFRTFFSGSREFTFALLGCFSLQAKSMHDA